MEERRREARGKWSRMVKGNQFRLGKMLQITKRKVLECGNGERTFMGKWNAKGMHSWNVCVEVSRIWVERIEFWEP